MKKSTKRIHSVFSCVSMVTLFVSTMFTVNFLYGSWTFTGLTATTGTITDGDWTLNVSFTTVDPDILAITSIEAPQGTNPEIDLGAPVSGGRVITGIGNSAFSGNTVVESVILPESLESIGNNAFSGCYSLTNVTPFLPDSLISLGNAAFYSCTNLTGILTLSNQDLKTVSDNCFYYAKVLSVDMSESGITKIAYRAFVGNDTMTDVILPEKLENIGQDAFSGNFSLTNVTPFLPDSLITLDAAAFYRCTNLTGNLILSNEDLKIVNNNAFYNTQISSVDMTGSGITTIGDTTSGSAFMSCTALESVLFSDCLQIIGKRAFNSTALSSVHFPESLTTLGAESFSGCSSLTNVTPFLPDSLTTLDSDVFNNCTSLTGSPVLSNQDLKIVNNYAFLNTKISSVDMTGSGITTIGNGAFQGCTALESVLFSDCLQNVNYRALNGCSSLRSLRFPESFTTFGDEVFSWCAALEQVWFCGDVPSFGNNVFAGWANFQTRFYIPKNNETWEGYKENPATLFTALSSGEEELFNGTYPGERLPVGTFWLIGMNSAYRQWYCLWDSSGEQLKTILIIR